VGSSIRAIACAKLCAVTVVPVLNLMPFLILNV
jgi:hypothetical protein